MPLKSPLLWNDSASSCSPGGDDDVGRDRVPLLAHEVVHVPEAAVEDVERDQPPSTVPIASSTPSSGPALGDLDVRVIVWSRLRTFTVTFSGIGAPFG